MLLACQGMQGLHLMVQSCLLATSWPQVVVVPGTKEEVVALPGEEVLLQCDGPVGRVTRCVWRAPEERLKDGCCYGDCRKQGRSCREAEVRRDVEGSLATCQLLLKEVREGEGGVWRCDLGYTDGGREVGFLVAVAGRLEWVGVKGEGGVRKLEGGETRLGCRVRGTAPLGELVWEVAGSKVNSSHNPLTVWEEEGEGGRVWGLQQSLDLGDLASLTGSSVFCRYLQRDSTQSPVVRSSLEAVVLGSPALPRASPTSSLWPHWATWATAGGVLVLLQLGAGLACVIARCAPARRPPPQETPL